MSEIAEPQSDAPVSMDATMLDQMHAAAGKASQLLKSLSHPDRLMLLCQLTQGEHCVSQLVKMVWSTPAARANKFIIQSPVRMLWQSSMYCMIAFVRQNN